MNFDIISMSKFDSTNNSTFQIKKFIKSVEPELEIDRIDFSLFSEEEIRQFAHLEIRNPDIYDSSPKRTINESGPLDLRLGTSLKSNTCKTCERDLTDCIGHFGFIDLPVPVYHVGYFKETIRVYQSVCKSCSSLLLTPDQKAYFTQKMREAEKLGKTIKRKLAKEISKSFCSKMGVCYYCGKVNGSVIKTPKSFGILHRRFQNKKYTKEKEKNLMNFKMALEMNNDLSKYLKGICDEPNPLTVYNLFQNISDNDIYLLNLFCNKPQDLLIKSLIVPPACIRPTVTIDDSTTQEDDLTVKLRSIVVISNLIKTLIEKGSTNNIIREHWVLLQSETARYINSDMPGFAKTGLKEKQILSLVQRICGKHGRLRGNLSGKRVDFSGRTVISPDPNLEIDQVGVPLDIAKILTYPDTVNDHNVHTLRSCVVNGPDVYPGANFVHFKKSNIKQFLKYGNKQETANNLRPGDIVERHLLNNDIVLFNRQPSLHRVSIMAHRVVVLPHRTLRFNVCVCNPYNADFDGDEMNIHVPQTEEARAEAAILMSVQNNFITPKCGEPLIVPIQDFLTASYLLSNKDRFFDKPTFMQICCFFSKDSERVLVPPPSILYPKILWTGKQVFSVLLRPNNDSRWPVLYLSTPTKHYPKKTSDPKYPREYLDPLDRFVYIKNSIHLCGMFDKAILGSSKTGIFTKLVSTSGPSMTAEIMGRFSKLCSRWLREFGFSIGIDDVTPSEALSRDKKRLMDDGYALCSGFETQYKDGKLKPQPGCTKLETLEAKMLGKLSDIREASGQKCIESLEYFKNSPIIMATCGSKGSTINIAQMIVCVGQQALQSGRIPEGFVNRTLPHFPKFSRSPEAKGFVRNSFFTGLNATEFFFHTMAGREGLIDTAVKTADTGYMQRRLMKALEDGCVQYDNTVRNCENVVLQFAYGEDGLDPIELGKGASNDFDELFAQTKTSCSKLSKVGQSSEQVDKALRFGLLPKEIISETIRILKTISERELRNVSEEVKKNFASRFEKDIRRFVEFKLVEDIKRLRKRLKLKINCRSRDNRLEMFCTSVCGVTKQDLNNFIEKSYDKYRSAFVEPGSAVGAMGAQSIGEPSTQMTLKTFHFAGVASMNITLGVPRIKEIINATLSIKTPIINAALDCVNSEQVARIVKGRLEITTLGGVSKYIRQFISNDYVFIEILIDIETVNKLMLEIDSESIKDSILKCKKLKLKESNVSIVSKYKLRITPPDTNRNSLLFCLERLALLLPNLQIKGIENIHRAVIRHPDPIVHRWEYCLANNKDSFCVDTARWKVFQAKENQEIEKATAWLQKSENSLREVEVSLDNGLSVLVVRNSGASGEAAFEGSFKGSDIKVYLRRLKVEYELTVEGMDFDKTITTSGVDGLNTTTNHIPEVERVLGIEAAREAITRELLFTFSVHGLTVDIRHIMLLADVMTFKGELLGITRFGITKMKDSVLMQASFETPMEHLFAAAVEGERDPIQGVSECIIIGATMPIGTGTFQLLRKVEPFEEEVEQNIF